MIARRRTVVQEVSEAEGRLSSCVFWFSEVMHADKNDPWKAVIGRSAFQALQLLRAPMEVLPSPLGVRHFNGQLFSCNRPPSCWKIAFVQELELGSVFAEALNKRLILRQLPMELVRKHPRIQQGARSRTSNYKVLSLCALVQLLEP